MNLSVSLVDMIFIIKIPHLPVPVNMECLILHPDVSAVLTLVILVLLLPLQIV